MIHDVLVWLRNNWKRLGGIEFSLLVSLVLVVGGIWLFIELTEELIEGQPYQLDREILLALREPGDPRDPIGPVWVEQAMVSLTALASTAVVSLITTAAVGYLILDHNYFYAMWIVLAVVGSSLWTFFFKDIVGRPRPDVVLPLVPVASLSFPSGHASVAAATYLTLGALVARHQDRRSLRAYVMALAILIVLLVGFSRVYLGVHWPSDVLGGWLLGGVWAILTLMLDLWWEQRTKPSDLV